MARLMVNGQPHTIDGRPRWSLLDVLRDELKLTGAKYGCGEGECGACTVLVDSEPARACQLDLDAVDGSVITTVEGLAVDGRLHPVQAEFVRRRAFQCGYCTPGMIVCAVALLAREPAPDERAVRSALAGNICRCGGYPGAVAAVLAAANSEVDSGPEIDSEPEVDSRGEAEDGAQASRWTVRLSLADAGSGSHRDWGWSTPGGAHLNIDAAGRVIAYVGKVDAGQGNRGALIRLIAAELALPTTAVRLEMGDTGSAPLDLGTFGSRSTPDAGRALRLLASAAARELCREAADRWRVDPAKLSMVDGAVHDQAGGRHVRYRELIAGQPRTIVADPDDSISGSLAGLTRRLAGVDSTESSHRLRSAVTGAKRFPSDVALPGMLHGKVLRPPSHGAVLRSVDTSAASQMPDVTVVAEHDFVAALAPAEVQATTAVMAIQAEWDLAKQITDAELIDYLRAHPIESPSAWGRTSRELGDVDTACAQAEICLTATYTCAYIAHVPLEPRVAVASPAGDDLTIWVGTQRPFGVRADVANALGLPTDRVRVVVPDFGGGFGGKHSADVAIEAARLARATGRPVRVAWTRAEEFRWAYFRPAAVIDVRAAASSGAGLTGWEFTNINSGSAGLFSPYEIANLRERYQRADSPLPQGSYRALAATANNFARESHLDEMAIALGVDAIELRLRQLGDARLAEALASVAQRIGWPGTTQSPNQGWGIGIACGVEKDARVATAVELSVGDAGGLELHRIVTAVDCGAIIDPTGLRNQIIGATVMGLGGALFEAIHVDQDGVANAALASYRVPRFTDVPPIDVILIDRPDIEPAGAGETPIIAVAPAIGNAVRAATGRRLTRLPMAPHGFHLM